MANITLRLRLLSDMRLSHDDPPYLSAAQLKGLLRAECRRIADSVLRDDLPSPDMLDRLFGTRWQEGALYFAELQTDAQPTLMIRNYVTHSRARSVVIRAETRQQWLLPAGTVFTGAIRYDVADLALVALTVAGLRAITSIGGGFGSGYGGCEIEAEALDRGGRAIPDQALVSALQDLTRPPL